MVDSTISRRATESSALRSMVLRPFSRKASMTFQISTKCTGNQTGSQYKIIYSIKCEHSDVVKGAQHHTHSCISFAQIEVCRLFCMLIIVWNPNREPLNNDRSNTFHNHIKVRSDRQNRQNIKYSDGLISFPLCTAYSTFWEIFSINSG